MSEKTLKALLGMVVGLGLVWLAVSFFPRSGQGHGEGSGVLSTIFAGVTPERVDAVRFSGPENQNAVELKRFEGGWRVNGFRVDSANLARFWDALEDAALGDLMASNPSNHPRLGVAVDSTWTVEFDLPGETRSIFFGNPGTQYGAAYVRLPQEDEVYLLEGNVRSHVTRSLDDWRNKSIARVDTAGVWRIEVERESGGLTLERSDSLWVFSEGGETDAPTVQAILGEMARLDASGFVQPGDSLSAAEGTLRAFDQEGNQTFSLELGSGEGDRWARMAGDSVIFRVASWRANRIMPSRDRVEGGGL